MKFSREEIKYLKFIIANDIETLENGDWNRPENIGQRILAKNLYKKITKEDLNNGNRNPNIPSVI